MQKRNSTGQFVKGSPGPNKGIFKRRHNRICEVCKKPYTTYHTISHTCSRICWKNHKETKKRANKHLKKARDIRSSTAKHSYNDGYGYIMIYCPHHPKINKKKPYIREHRLIMEKHIGRFLHKEEVIHNIDGNRSNNSVENLELLPNHSIHMKMKHKH